MSVSGGVKKLMVRAAIGSLAPIVLIIVLAQRTGHRRLLRILGKLAERFGPYKHRLGKAQKEWRSEITVSEVIDWVLQGKPGGR